MSDLALATEAAPATARPFELGFRDVTPGIRLRTGIIHNPGARGTVLLLHGFPETLLTWQGVAARLGSRFEVHAFDWPGYGQSSRPAGFGYAPSDYAGVLRAYVEAAGLDRTRLLIHANDIGGLPALLAALAEPGIARRLLVGDFAPLDRPQHLHERLQRLLVPATADAARQSLNATRDEVLSAAFTRGMPADVSVPVSPAFHADMLAGWTAGGLTSADAFARHYGQFTRDQRRFERQAGALATPLSISWGERDVYIDPAMGQELAALTGSPFRLLPGIGHYPHLQDPNLIAAEITAAYD